MFKYVKNFINKHILRKVYCDYCQKWHNKKDIKIRRLNTAYIDDKLNYIESCEQFFKDSWKMYDEQWRDYYASR